MLNEIDKMEIKNNINNIDQRFNKLQASIAMDQLKNHWKSKYGSSLHYESTQTQKTKDKTIKNTNRKQKTKQTQQKQENKILNNSINNNSKITDSLESITRTQVHLLPP